MTRTKQPYKYTILSKFLYNKPFVDKIEIIHHRAKNKTSKQKKKQKLL